MILITGGAGFIGANFAMYWGSRHSEAILNLDALTYAANPKTLEALARNSHHRLVRGSICDGGLLTRLLTENAPRAIVHFAAETHVDRSILGPDAFVQTNVVGTSRLLEAVRAYWSGLAAPQRRAFRFVHVSTDEIYGDLPYGSPPFSEMAVVAPNSPYSASKAASNHLVRAYHRTYGLPGIIVNCSNNYGPYQFPEKLIPLMLRRALDGRSLPLYGDGQQIRDWLYVEDHCHALEAILARGRVGEVYNVGGSCQLTNLAVAHGLCTLLDNAQPRADGNSYRQQIALVPDRPGHDRRYALDISKITEELGWKPLQTFASGLRKTVDWYLNNRDWINHAAHDAYHDWGMGEYDGPSEDATA